MKTFSYILAAVGLLLLIFAVYAMFDTKCYDTFVSCLATYLIMYTPGIGFIIGAYLIWKKAIIGSTSQTIEQFIAEVDGYWGGFLVLIFIIFTSARYFF